MVARVTAPSSLRAAIDEVASPTNARSFAPDVPSLIGAHASGLLDGDVDQLSEAVSFFKRSPRPLSQAGQR
jgi:hypothetical protein